MFTYILNCIILNQCFSIDVPQGPSFLQEIAKDNTRNSDTLANAIWSNLCLLYIRNFTIQVHHIVGKSS